MASIVFDEMAISCKDIANAVGDFLRLVKTLDEALNSPIIVFQDGKSKAYYIKCNISALDAKSYCDTNARLNVDNPEAFRANRELLLRNKTYAKMQEDAMEGREFNDIIVEYSTAYNRSKPMKVWGGQHRVHAIMASADTEARYHGFRVYFGLSKGQRTEVALISNTNIAVSNDTFDRMVEETIFGDSLLQWCHKADLIADSENFPDVGSTAEGGVTVKLARTFVVNFYLGKSAGKFKTLEQLEKSIHEPYIAESGPSPDPKYQEIVRSVDFLSDAALLAAGRGLASLNVLQREAVVNASKSKSGQPPKIKNNKGFRNKAMYPSVVAAWSFIAGLLQEHEERLRNHYSLPKTSSRIPDPLNVVEMTVMRHNSDERVYRGLGTRSDMKERQRMAHVFLARSRSFEGTLTKTLMTKSIKRVVGLQNLKESY